jgi:CrcB protein
MTAPVVALFVVAAVAGAWIRIGATRRFNRWSFPAGTFLVNVAGSLAAGLLATRLDGDARTVVVTAGLGALTTYSSFAGEVRALARDGRIGTAAVYVAGTVVGCVAAGRIGLAVSL